MKNRKIFYFSGTGNSYYCADYLGQKLSIEVEEITDELNIEKEFDYLGIVFPIYALGPPNIVKRFIKKLKGIRSKYTFIVATYGGVYGNALKYMKKILKENDQELKYAVGIKFPDNYIITFKVPKKTKQKKLFIEADEKLEKISTDLKAEKNFIEKDKIITTLLPVSIYTYSSKRFRIMGKSFVNGKECNMCGLCKKVCPVGNISIKNNQIIFGERCELCLRCMHLCPKKSINYKNKTKNKTRYLNPNNDFGKFLTGKRSVIDKNTTEKLWLTKYMNDWAKKTLFHVKKSAILRLGRLLLN